jgi:hypothetical protein
MRVQHFDRISIRWDASTLRPQPDGSRFVDGFGAHVGNYTYHDDQGRPFIEHVPAETLFDSKSLASSEGSTLTIRHGPGLVTPDRYRKEAHGSWVKSWDAGDGNLGVRLRLGSQEAIDFIDRAIAKGDPVELSPVYEVDVADEPGTTEHGRHDAVQRDRVYSGIALLGPDEARGGSGMRLQLDGPECAPEGARMQVSAGRLDSAPRVPLHSTPTRSQQMKHVTLSGGGHSCKISLDRLRGLRAMKIDAKNADQIETTEVTWQSGDEEPGMMVIPTSMWEAMLETVGAAAPAVAAEPMPEEEVALEAADADDDEKLDARIMRLAQKVAADAIGKHEARRTKADALRATVHADAGRVLPPGYDYSVHWTQVALDAIAKAKPDSETRAKDFADKAKRGDSVSQGRLLEMLSQCSAKEYVTPSAAPTTQADDRKPAPWASPVMPKVSN